MSDEGWSQNLLTSGSLNSPNVLSEGRWSFGKRRTESATSTVEFVSRGTYQGSGAMRTRVTAHKDDPLAGGYEGTIVQIRSPSVRIPAGRAVRIDAMIRTLGFGGPHQGVLVYDSTGGQDMGVLVRGKPDWTPVRLYRQVTQETEVSVMFEILGGGEAMIDEVEMRIWEPQIKPQPMLRPIIADIPTAPNESRR